MTTVDHSYTYPCLEHLLTSQREATATTHGWKSTHGCVQVYIIEANPRASRTVPFVAKAIGHPIAKYASLIMSGKTLKELDFTEEPKLDHVAVKEAVLPFDKFPGDATAC